MQITNILKKCIGFIALIIHPLLIALIISGSLPSIPGKTLFIFSKPTDALMYFFPSILQSDIPILLCISSSEFDESEQIAKFLGICSKFHNAKCIFDTNFTSKSSEKWSSESLRKIIMEYIEQYKPKRIFTFGLNTEYSQKSDHNTQISKALSFPTIRVGEMSIQKLSDISLNYQNSSYQDINSFHEDENCNLSAPVYFLKPDPRFLRYSGYFSPLLYSVANTINKGFFVITPPSELISMKIRYSLMRSNIANSSDIILEMLFSRYFYFNHFLQQQLTSIQS